MQLSCWLELRSHLKAQLQEDSLPSSLMWHISAPCWLLARLQFITTWASSLFAWLFWWHVAGFSQTSNRKWEQPRQKPQSFYSLILEVTYHHFCYVLFSRSKSLSPACMQRAGIIQVWSSGHRDYGGQLGAIYHMALIQSVRKPYYPCLDLMSSFTCLTYSVSATLASLLHSTTIKSPPKRFCASFPLCLEYSSLRSTGFATSPSSGLYSYGGLSCLMIKTANHFW